MDTALSFSGRSQPRKEIEDLIKTVADMICAADNPDSALTWALLILITDVQGVNGAAKAYIAALPEDHVG